MLLLLILKDYQTKMVKELWLQQRRKTLLPCPSHNRWHALHRICLEALERVSSQMAVTLMSPMLLMLQDKEPEHIVMSLQIKTPFHWRNAFKSLDTSILLFWKVNTGSSSKKDNACLNQLLCSWKLLIDLLIMKKKKCQIGNSLSNIPFLRTTLKH